MSVENLNEIYFELGISKIHNIGLIAIRPIPKNTLLFKIEEFQPIFITFKELKDKKIPISVINTIKKKCAHDKNSIEITNDLFDKYSTRWVNYMNHSYNPNLYFNNNCYYSRKKIKKGEELTLNYKENDYCIKCVDFRVKS